VAGKRRWRQRLPQKEILEAEVAEKEILEAETGGSSGSFCIFQGKVSSNSRPQDSFPILKWVASKGALSLVAVRVLLFKQVTCALVSHPA
jgi:hypothetical protein